MCTIVETPRLIIREFLPGEETVFLDHFMDEEVARYIPKRSREERAGIFRSAVAAYEASKQLGTWGIFGKADGCFIGSGLLRLFGEDPAKVELGYSLERKYWGQGLATEMTEALVNYAFTHTGTNQVVAVTVFENIASQRVLLKAGFEQKDNLVRNGMELAYFEMSKR
jgi:[ribosomal protein S5]-alanine N-acetyltransferase